MTGLIKLSEATIKNSIADYLETLQAMGKLIYFRLNAGTFIMGSDGTKRVIKGCKAGTSDFLVIRLIKFNNSFMSHEVIFLEVKKSDWEPRKAASKRKKPDTEIAQEEFQKLVESQGHLYKIVRSVDEVIELLK